MNAAHLWHDPRGARSLQYDPANEAGNGLKQTKADRLRMYDRYFSSKQILIDMPKRSSTIPCASKSLTATRGIQSSTLTINKPKSLAGRFVPPENATHANPPNHKLPPKGPKDRCADCCLSQYRRWKVSAEEQSDVARTAITHLSSFARGTCGTVAGLHLRGTLVDRMVSWHRLHIACCTTGKELPAVTTASKDSCKLFAHVCRLRRNCMLEQSAMNRAHACL